MKKGDVAVIGAGPAGVAAAMQLARYEARPFVYEMYRPGGLVRNARLVENYPGFPRGIGGPELGALLAGSLERSEADVSIEEVTGLDFAGGVYRVSSERGEADYRAVIVATGTEPVPLEGSGIDREAERAILYEIESVRDVSGRSIAVIGAGDAAFDYALTLARNNDVVIVGRSARASCNASLARSAAESERITVLLSASVGRISAAEGGKSRLEISLGGCAGETTMVADHVIAAVGRSPRAGFISDKIMNDLDVLFGAGTLHLAGDVRGGRRRQTAIAAGDGVLAAMEIYESIGLD